MKDPQSIDAPRPDKDPEGKRHPRLNSHTVCLRGEERAYEEHCRITLDLLAPAGGFERYIAQSVADGRWRLQRARSIEATLLASFPESDRSLRFLKVYKRNIQRACNRDLAELEAVQAGRKKARKEAIQEAMNRPTYCIN